MPLNKVDSSIIHGYVSPRFEKVKEEFERNFLEREEIGAACAIYHKGNKVVDLWGGYRDIDKFLPWEEDTLILVFSTTKGFSALTLAVAHSKGLLDYDEKVATYWPEFSQNGKSNITVRQLLSHQAGLCRIDKLNIKDICDLETKAVSKELAKQKPSWSPGEKQGYHCWTLGWYEGELLRRVDPQQRSLGVFFQEEIAEPLGLELYIGLQEEVDDSRIAHIKGINHPLQLFLQIAEMPFPLLKEFLKPWSLTMKTMVDPNRHLAHKNFNGKVLRSLELPSGNGIGLVRSMAKLYSVFATGGTELGLRHETLDELAKPPIPPSGSYFDEIIRDDIAYSLGLMKPFEKFEFGTNNKSFGHSGAGGSFCFADPDEQVGFAYAMNKLKFKLRNDPREKALRDAFYKCIK